MGEDIRFRMGEDIFDQVRILAFGGRGHFDAGDIGERNIRRPGRRRHRGRAFVLDRFGPVLIENR